MKNLCSTLLVLIALTAPVKAVVLFDNGSPDDQASFFFADTGEAFSAAGNIFNDTTSGTANAITFYGNYSLGTPTSDSFVINLYGVNSSGATPVPGSLITSSPLTSESRTTASTPTGNTFEFTGTLSHTFALSAGTAYFLDISDTDTPFENFGVNTSVGTEAEFSYANGAFSPGPVFGQNLSFSLSGSAVPEPAVSALLAGGAAGLLMVARRQR